MPETDNNQQPITHALRDRGQGHKMTDTERANMQNVFLKAFELNGNILLSCKKVKIDRSTFYYWTEHDEEFNFRYHQAERDFADIILAEFVKRATTGYEKPVVSMGKVVYQDGKPLTERVVSDNLLAMAVKKHFPEYREKQQAGVEVNVQAGSISEELRMLSDEQLSQLKSWIADAKAREISR